MDGWMNEWMLFNDTSAQFRPFSILERLEQLNLLCSVIAEQYGAVVKAVWPGFDSNPQVQVPESNIHAAEPSRPW